MIIINFNDNNNYNNNINNNNNINDYIDNNNNNNNDNEINFINNKIDSIINKNNGKYIYVNLYELISRSKEVNGAHQIFQSPTCNKGFIKSNSISTCNLRLDNKDN